MGRGRENEKEKTDSDKCKKKKKVLKNGSDMIIMPTGSTNIAAEVRPLQTFLFSQLEISIAQRDECHFLERCMGIAINRYLSTFTAREDFRFCPR